MSTTLWGFIFGLPIGYLTRLVYVGWRADRDTYKKAVAREQDLLRQVRERTYG